ncbi:MAG: glycosyltransferase family 4 protein [Lachnospiraceae bacterium]|nr:glycosyltransferase family 4 protein [Lachnospiraceae bacterium]
MFGHKHIPSREGGVEIVVEHLAVRMVRMGHKVTCYNRGGSYVESEDAEFDEDRSRYRGVKIKKAFTINAKGLAAASSSFFASLAAGLGKYDVVHIHAEGPCILCGFLKACDKRVIVTIHGLDHKRAKWGRFASWYIMKGEQAAAKYADEIIVLSKSVQDYFLELYGRRTTFIPNGVEEAKQLIPDIIRTKWGLDKDDYILYLGRIVPEKGIHYLIEAYKGLNTDKKLVIAGGSSDTDEYYSKLKDMAEGTDNIIFTGFVQGPTLEELYSNAYIYCLPSDLEGMPLSLLEAMSYGNACLTSDIPECADVIADKGMTFKKGDVVSLKDRLSELIDDKAAVEAYKAQAATYITERYNWDESVNRTLKLYDGNEA